MKMLGPTSCSRRTVIVFTLLLVGSCQPAAAVQTEALWVFDEQIGIYPSCCLSDQSETDIPLILGRGGQIVPGKFGNALEPTAQPQIVIPKATVPEGAVQFGLAAPQMTEGRTVPPMTWRNANFCALTTQGENHLRKGIQFQNPTRTKLNLGAFDWTVEFWFRPTREANEDGVVFELGRGPRGENDHVTRLLLNADCRGFTLFNQPSGTTQSIPSAANALTVGVPQWHHLAFVYSAGERQLRHYADGELQPLGATCRIRSLPVGKEAYLSIGRDGSWQRPLSGRIDELRFATGLAYTSNFQPPPSLASHAQRRPARLQQGPPLLFGKTDAETKGIALEARKHVFIDDGIVAEMKNITFVPNPPVRAERAVYNLRARKHLTVIQDQQGLIRLYYPASQDRLAVMTSKDGLHFEKPLLNKNVAAPERNIVNFDKTGVGSVFVDPNAPKSERWKYISGYDERGIFVYTSPDGWSFKREKTAVLPFRSGSQTVCYYDDQRQTYVTFDRTGIATHASGTTRREFVRTETADLMSPWPFRPVSQEQTELERKRRPLKPLSPYYLDNGPLTPGGFGMEYPISFAPDDHLDPIGANIYVPKAVKYASAPDTYLAFPTVYFNYQGDGPPTRQVLGQQDRGRGSGPSEVQLAVSRDGIHWKRYPRPTYVGIGKEQSQENHEIYMVHGLVRRGDEIWQYYFGRAAYHSAWRSRADASNENSAVDSVFRVVQRLDGFVSADAAYTGGWLKTRALTFTGNRLVLNIDTDAMGYAQVGILDAEGNPIKGYHVDDCIYINGDFIRTEVEWIDKGKDLTALQGQPVQLLFRMRGSKLYTMQFVKD